MDQTESKSDTTAHEPPKDARKILLVEDDVALADVYKTRLEAEDYAVKHASSGEEALEILSDFHPDLVLLDIILPKISGFEVLKSLRDHPETAKTKVVVLSAYGNDEDRRRAHELGADDYLVKSQVVIADVIEKVKHIIWD